MTYNADSVNTSKPTGVALLGLRDDEVVETLAAAFFHGFKAETEIHGKVQTEVVMGLEDVEPAKYRALVVCRTTTNHDIVRFVYIQLEWIIRGPAIALVCL